MSAVSRIDGLWRSQDVPGASARTARHTYYFSPHGELLELGDGDAPIAMLTWRARGAILVIDQPSAPREEHLHLSRASEHTMQIGADWYVRDADGRVPPELPFTALMAGAAWHGVANAHEGEPFIPFLMVEVGRERTLHRIVASDHVQAEATARGMLVQTLHDRAMWVRDGRITLRGEKIDAVVMERHERGRHTHDVALPYRFVGGTAKIAGPLQVQARE